MLQVPGATSYIGCIGKDKFGEEMKKDCTKAGVNVSCSKYWPLTYLSAVCILLVYNIIYIFVTRYNIMRMKRLQQAHVQCV